MPLGSSTVLAVDRAVGLVNLHVECGGGIRQQELQQLLATYTADGTQLDTAAFGRLGTDLHETLHDPAPAERIQRINALLDRLQPIPRLRLHDDLHDETGAYFAYGVTGTDADRIAAVLVMAIATRSSRRARSGSGGAPHPSVSGCSSTDPATGHSASALGSARPASTSAPTAPGCEERAAPITVARTRRSRRRGFVEQAFDGLNDLAGGLKGGAAVPALSGLLAALARVPGFGLPSAPPASPLPPPLATTQRDNTDIGAITPLLRHRPWRPTARRGFSVDAFDVSPAAVAHARRRFGENDVRFTVEDLRALPEHWAAAFDLVVEVYKLQVLPPEPRAWHCVRPLNSLHPAARSW